MPHLDEGTIHAWLDGALSDDEALAVSAHVASCTSCANAVAEARGLVAASSRILSALDAVPSRVIPTAPAAAVRRAVWWRHPAVGIAAAIVVVTAGTLVARREIHTPEAQRAVASPAPHEVAKSQASPAPVAAPVTAPVAAPPRSPAPLSPEETPATRMKASYDEKRLGSAEGAALGVVARRSGPDSSVVRNELASTMAKTALADAAPAAPSVKVAAQRPARADQPSLPRALAAYDVRAQSGQLERRVYEVRDGVRVTLEIAAAQAERDALSGAAESRVADAAAPPAARAMQLAAIHVIQWSDSSGTRYTLSGPLSAEELERVKAALPPLH